ncbi:DUF4158 domain-containing protein [Nonomuraea jabiensis]|uniref:DUF4158 domain-containing protein n=1 Tax=Nonomuraea jabiensis TaxID=882448 RepID=UPI0036C817F9
MSTRVPGCDRSQPSAYPRFKRFLSARELHVFYTPQTEEIAWASGRVRSDNHLLALMVQLKCFNRMGYFPGWMTSRRQWWPTSAEISGWARTSPRCTTRTGPGAIIGC